MRLLNELAEYPLMKQVRGSDSTDDEQVHLLFVSLSRVPQFWRLDRTINGCEDAS